MAIIKNQATKQVIFINSHPIQYFAPLYKYLNEHGISTSAWYCSDESVKGKVDKEFGVEVKWDIPLLNGYPHTFFKNYSYKPSHANGFFGLMNFGLIRKLFSTPKSLVIVHGWHYFTHLCVLLLAGLRGHTVCLRYEMPYNQEVLKNSKGSKLKRFFLKHFVFPRVDYFLYIGTQNRLLYEKAYGIKPERLLFCPYSVDNNRFSAEFERLKGFKNILKEKLGIPAESKVILYSGKYIDKKNPLDILNAFVKLERNDCWLVMLGEGELRPQLEELIRRHNLNNVMLTGFVNQSQVGEYYSISDIFVMCSTVGETWGLSVNEAMNFNLPLIISDLTGCAVDLVQEGVNGYVFKTGDVSDLAAKLEMALFNDGLPSNNHVSGLLQNFSYNSICKSLTTII